MLQNNDKNKYLNQQPLLSIYLFIVCVSTLYYSYKHRITLFQYHGLEAAGLVIIIIKSLILVLFDHVSVVATTQYG